jgi:hypothetical protein
MRFVVGAEGFKPTAGVRQDGEGGDGRFCNRERIVNVV